MVKYYLFLLLIFYSLSTKAQTRVVLKGLEADTLIFYKAEHSPEFPGGLDKFVAYLAKNIKYPKEAINDIQGRIIVQMIIEKNGSISNVKLLNVRSKALDQEIARVLLSSPKWKPGTVHGKPVRVNYPIPITCLIPSMD